VRFRDGDTEAVFEWDAISMPLACFLAAMFTLFQAAGLMMIWAGLQRLDPAPLAIGAAWTCAVTLLEVAQLRATLSKTMIMDKARREVRIRRFLSEVRIPFGDIAEVGLVLSTCGGWIVWPVLRTKAGHSIRLPVLDAGPDEAHEAHSTELRAKWIPVLETVARAVGAEARVSVK